MQASLFTVFVNNARAIPALGLNKFVLSEMLWYLSIHSLKGFKCLRAIESNINDDALICSFHWNFQIIALHWNFQIIAQKFNQLIFCRLNATDIANFCACSSSLNTSFLFLNWMMIIDTKSAVTFLFPNRKNCIKNTKQNYGPCSLCIIKDSRDLKP